jgi:hypothetical protein
MLNYYLQYVVIMVNLKREWHIFYATLPPLNKLKSFFENVIPGKCIPFIFYWSRFIWKKVR